MPDPWQCPSCRAWIRPDIETHRCDPDGGVTASLPASPKKPPALAAVGGGSGGSGGATSVTWTFPPGTVGTSVSTTSGRYYELSPPGPVTVSVTLDGRTLYEATQREALLYNIRQGRRGGSGGGGGAA